MRCFSGAHRPVLRAVIVAMATGLVAACAVPTQGPKLLADTPTTMGLGAAPAGSAGAPGVQPVWWQGLDPQLDHLMADALTGNPSLAGVRARVAAARAGLVAARAGLLPQLSGDASVQRQLLSNEYIYPAPLGGSYVWLGNAEADLGWSLDLAGRQKALVKSAAARADAAALDAAAAQVSLSGAVVQAYVTLAGAVDQADLADARVVTSEKKLARAKARVSSGLAGNLDLRDAEAALATAEGIREYSYGEVSVARHTLAALAGRGPNYATTIARPAPGLNSALENSLPLPARLTANLLGDRADILAARARIEASMANRRAARAAFYPDIDLTAFIGAQALGLGEMINPSARTLGAGPALHLPIFEGGRLAAAYRGATADLDAAIAAYNETVVRAVKEAADALSGVEAATQEAAKQKSVVNAQAAALTMIRARVDNGLAGTQDLIRAQETLITARQLHTAIATQGAVRRIRLVVALGGGFAPAVSPVAIGAPSSSAQRPQP